MQTYVSLLCIQMYWWLFANTNRQSKIIEQNWDGGITMGFRNKCEHNETQLRSFKLSHCVNVNVNVIVKEVYHFLTCVSQN